MDKFKIGDKVLIVGAQENIRDMQKMIGTVSVITYVHHNVYMLADDPGKFCWLEDWLDFENEITITDDDLSSVLKPNNIEG